MKYTNFLTPHISRNILLSLSNDDKYSKWMKNYLSPKEFYKIRRLGLDKLTISELCMFFIKELKKEEINIDSKDFDFLLRKNNRLKLILIFLRSITQDSNKQYKSILTRYIFLSRINKEKSISDNNINNKFIQADCQNTIKIIAPICPDYAFTCNKERKYNYTFESVNGGIGLVALKAISTYREIEKNMKDIKEDFFNIELLIGDFECNESNLKRLNETKLSFINKLTSSIDVIKKAEGINCNLFTKNFGGLNGWNLQKQLLKTNLNLNEYSDLVKRYPLISHDKNLISRLPLYKKWHGNGADYKKIFLEQVLEYILMGKLIYEYYGNNALLLASDHKVMRSYYSISSEISIIGSSALY